MKITDNDGTGRIVAERFSDVFHKLWAEALAEAADIGRLRINRLRIIGLGKEDDFTLQVRVFS